MITAYTYFAVISLALLWKAVVHTFCSWNMNTYRSLHVDEGLRTLARDMHVFMALMSLTMLWFHWMILDFMVTFCATMPWLGFVAHFPIILVVYFQAVNATRHLKRQRDMIKDRLVA